MDRTPEAKAPIIAASQFIAATVDPGSFASWDRPPRHPSRDAAYEVALEAARQRSGTDEAVLTGVGTIDGRRVAIIAGEFAFLAGSIGLATASRIIEGLERATAEGLPVVASPSSGGTRMQEGTPAFLAMALIASAVERHKSAGNPYLVYLRHPTTGGAMASWGSLGHLTFAQPGALLGFLGPRVYEALHGEPFPAGVQTAENLERHGLVDAVVPLDGLRSVVSDTLRYAWPGGSSSSSRRVTLGGPGVFGGVLSPLPPSTEAGSAWDVVLRSRNRKRPGLRELLSVAAQNVVVQESGSLSLALASFGEARCLVVGQERHAQAGGQLIGPAQLATARRGMRLAQELGLPLLTVIDTPGGELSADAEEGGLAREIARCLAFLPTLSVPTLSFILGEGTGGAAIALLPADRIICAHNAWLAPLAPEGASAILHRDTTRAPELAQSLRITADDLVACGAVSTVVAEKPDAAVESAEFCRRAGQIIEQNLLELQALCPRTQAAVSAVAPI
ncbi:acetyl-CoA carboxyl transferase [Arthrobacter sp. AQ5-06]|nr:acetyl-CoA carboxyl transferase [Arthrobacter sp. AQ5-06]